MGCRTGIGRDNTAHVVNTWQQYLSTEGRHAGTGKQKDDDVVQATARVLVISFDVLRRSIGVERARLIARHNDSQQARGAIT